jgi:hypothetical protein
MFRPRPRPRPRPHLLAASLFLSTALAAQDTVIVIRPESSGVSLEVPDLPRAVVDEVIRFYNAPGTARLVGRVHLPAGATWRGDVAVRTGPAVVAGRIDGALVVINGDLHLVAGAVVTGRVVVVGGRIAGVDSATVGGGVRAYEQPLWYRVEDDSLFYTPGIARRFRGLGARHSWGTEESNVSLLIATGGTYNRVEGLPIIFGPTTDLRLGGDARLRMDALGVFRTGGEVAGEGADLGYMVRGEWRRGEVTGYGAGFRAYDAVTPIEDWGLSKGEVGWSAFVFHRDYRDYFENRGVALRLFAQPARALTLGLEAQYERHVTRAANDPIAVLRNDESWRPNAPADDGHYAVFAVAAAYDTRNDRWDPTSGWFVRGTLESGGAGDVAPSPGVPAGVRDPLPADGYRFGRLWLDARRYTRLSQGTRVNARLLAGGWFGGDPLPLQRRLSLGGGGSLPGYGFRYQTCGVGVTDSLLIAAQAALCDRLLLVQAEFRGHVSLRWVYDPDRDGAPSGLLDYWLEGLDVVVFADAGQAWVTGSGPGRVPSGRIPAFKNWLADLGFGLDWGGFGVYLAKAATADEPFRMVVRLSHRF